MVWRFFSHACDWLLVVKVVLFVKWSSSVNVWLYCIVVLFTSHMRLICKLPKDMQAM